MKKILLTINFFLVVFNLYFFIQDSQNKTSIHAVSQSVAQTETGAVLEDKTLVSKGYATIKQIEEKTLEEIYPNLKITGELKEGRLNLIKKILLDLPSEKLQNFRSLNITQIKGNNRGLGGASTVILNDYELSEQEFVSVFVHELGHVIDLGGIQGTPEAEKSPFNDGPNPIFTNDLSTVYYAYSWNDAITQKTSAERLDFVSGYAMTDPFEDFAESFTYYYLHNQDFKILTQNNEKLELKYSFIRDFIFSGEELDSGEGDVNPNKRVWDITKLAIII